jgi:hypothetical protein
MTAHSALLLSAGSPSWRDLYRLALYETDRGKISSRIIEAERALVLREHELFTRASEAAERAAVNSALHSLQALKDCLNPSRKRFSA